MELAASAKETRTEYVKGLRELADALEADLTLPQPFGALLAFPGEDSEEEMARIAKAIPGRVEKVHVDGALYLKRAFGPVKYEVYSSNICKRVQVGTKTVTEEEPVGTRTVTKTVPVYEYRCPDSILGRAA